MPPKAYVFHPFYTVNDAHRVMAAIGRSVRTHSHQRDQLLTIILDDKKADGKDEEKIVGECLLLHRTSSILSSI
jgi:hypothetical protein